MYISLSENYDFSTKYEVVISEDLQLACFDRNRNLTRKYIDLFFSSVAYSKSEVLLVATRFYGDNRCNRRDKSLPIASDFAGLDYLIKRGQDDGKRIVVLSNVPEFPARGGLIIRLYLTQMPLSRNFDISIH